MERTPEPELMEDAEQVSAYAAADFSAGDQAVISRLGVLFPDGIGERVLDLGCGPGNITFRLAEAYSHSEVIGVDGSEAMLALADERLARQPKLASRVSFKLAYLPSDSLPDSCTAIVSNSLLHQLHKPEGLWETITNCGSQGTIVYMKDLRRPASADTAKKLCLQYAGDAPEVLQHDYLCSLHAAFTPEEVQEQLRICGLTELAVAAVEDRYLEVWGRLP